MASKYWMIHNPANRAPEAMHYTIEEAEIEAERLALLHPGDRFVILEAVRVVYRDFPPPTVEKID